MHDVAKKYGLPHPERSGALGIEMLRRFMDS